MKRAADNFVQWATAKLQEQDEDTQLEVQTELPQKRIRKRKTMLRQLSQDGTGCENRLQDKGPPCHHGYNH